MDDEEDKVVTKLVTCPNKCLIILSDMYTPGWLKCSCCGYMRKKTKEDK